MKNRFVPAMPEGLARACPPGLAAVLMAGLLSACGGGGGGGGGGTPTPTATLSADQKIYEDAALHGGIGGISYNVPYGGGVLASGNSFVYSTLTTLSASPLASGSQTVTPRLATVAPSLTPPSPHKSWYLVGGQFVARSTTANEQVSYDGTAVQVVRYADDNQTIVDGFHEDAFREVALSGSVSSAPAELLGVLPLDQWAAGGNFSAATPWQPGAFYVARKETLTADRTLLEACYPLANLATASTATMPPPCFSGSLASRFPLTLWFPASSHPRETYAAADGTVSTLQGLQVWTANQPEPGGGYLTRSYRVFIQQGGAIYAGVMQRQGTAATSTLSDGSVVGEVFALNQAAISTVGQGVVLTPSTPRQTAGILRGLSTLDLYGIGGTGVNGALSPQDLRTHYDVPPALDGTGQTIAVVDSPGPSWINYIDDLQAYSLAFGLPVCASAAGSCFQHVDLSNGAFIGSSQVLVNTDERAVPDVTAVADPAHSPVAMYFRQRWTMEGGTSVGAPLWAGITALIAQQKAAAGTSLAASVAAAPGGFNGLLYRGNLFATANPALEALAGGTIFAQEVSCGSCSVVPGYNDVAGLGTPDVASLIAAF